MIFKKEPALIIGGLISLLMYLQEELQTTPGDALTWKTLGGIVAGLVIRYFVYSPATTERIAAKAKTDG